MDKVLLLTYNDVIRQIESEENNLLIGNGFNYGLGINTGYMNIFKKMAENNKGVYNDALKLFEECGCDLENFIGRLEQDIATNNVFLRKYIVNKIKFDFMQATHEIVKSEIKNIYAQKNEGIYILLKNFTNYFSLNYDSSLYIILLKFKIFGNDQKNTLVLEPTIKFIEDDLNKKKNDIYTEIKEARNKGNLEINFGDDHALMQPLKNLPKGHFESEVTTYSKADKKGWKKKDINKVVKLIFEEECENRVLTKVDDGSRQLKLFGENNEYVFDLDCQTQNLFFLHGAFHIYKDGRIIKKITQQTDKALYDRLDEILGDENKDIVCVFQHKDKIDEIYRNDYLLKCFNKLSLLTGNLIIIGCSLSDNDNHIFTQINKSEVHTIYISVLAKDYSEMMKIAKVKFPDKTIYLFNAETISYEMTMSIN